MRKNIHEYLIGAEVNINGVNGTIINVKPNKDCTYLVLVRTEKGLTTFTPDGKTLSNYPPTLRFGHSKTGEFDYGTPPKETKEPLLELTPITVECWVTNSINEFHIRSPSVDLPVTIVYKTPDGRYLDSRGYKWNFAWQCTRSKQEEQRLEGYCTGW